MTRIDFFLQQVSIRLVYRNRLFLTLFKMLSSVRARGQALGRMWSKHRKPELPLTDAATSEFARLERYRSEYSQLPGWFMDDAQSLWDCLLCYQRSQHIEGNLLEVGVWKGKSAAFSTLHAGSSETCVFVDRMILPEFRTTMKSIRKGGQRFLETCSSRLLDVRDITAMKKSFRWIHIDGEHSGEAVYKDLATAEELLSERGVVCIDDFASCAYPQVTFAVTEFLCQHSTLTMFICGHNKGYICRQAVASEYLSFVKDQLHEEMGRRGSQVTIWKSGRPSDRNCFGITQRVGKFAYRGPDWDTLTIETH